MGRGYRFSVRIQRPTMPLYIGSRMYTMLLDMTSTSTQSEGQANSSEKPTPEQKLKGITTKSSKPTRGVTRIVYRPARRGHGVIVPGAHGMRSPNTLPQNS